MEVWARRISFIKLTIMSAVAIHATFFTGLIFIPCFHPPVPLTCTNSECYQEVSRLNRRIDFTANPCNNFYKFACGSFQESSHQIMAVIQEVNSQYIDLYNEPIKENDHVMVKTMKKLYRACLREVAIDTRARYLDNIKNVLAAAGGWPVLEGAAWNGTKFDWLQATYKLRELGYHYSVFLDLSIWMDPRNDSHHIFAVSLPRNPVVEKEIMVDVAVVLGADKDSAAKELDDVHILMEHLFENEVRDYVMETVAKYQESQKHRISWLEFINKIANPAVQVSKDDLVIFPQAKNIAKRLSILWNIRKRVVANYMMWRVLENTAFNIIPGILNERHTTFSSEQFADRRKVCLSELQQRFQFVPNPMDVLYIKKYLPQSKLQKVRELAAGIKSEFLALLQQAKWMDAKDKRNAVNRLEKKAMIVGAPDDYINGKILDEIEVDMEEIDEDEDYFSQLFRINRNYRSLFFKKVTRPVADTALNWNLFRVTDVLIGIDNANTAIQIPATILQGFVFNENKPNYINYGTLGSFIASQFFNQFIKLLQGCACGEDRILWTIKTQQGFKRLRSCWSKRIEALDTEGLSILNLDLISVRYSIGSDISYSAYKKWEKRHGVEPKLPGISSTNKQLFWMSAASSSCRPPNNFESPLIRDFSSFLAVLLVNKKDFARDFSCPVGSNKINSLVDKCDVF